MNSIKYYDYVNAGYKYILAEDYALDLRNYGVVPMNTPSHDYVFIEDGFLILREGYAWDGPSGPALDTKDFMRPSLIHDALYQLIELEWMELVGINAEPGTEREVADGILYKLCREDKMPWLRAHYVWAAVRLFGGSFTNKRITKTNPKEVKVAP